MELPLELQMIINDYARPIGRPDWRLGSYMMRELRAIPQAETLFRAITENPDFREILVFF